MKQTQVRCFRNGNVVMEKLVYTIEDSAIAKILGKENFSNKESAVLELVKNAYDANASLLTIRFEDGELNIIDDGEGMSADDIKNAWMHVGKSSRGYSLDAIEGGEARVAAGAKGIGRFALARLGDFVELVSHKNGFEPIRWITDWSSSQIEISNKDVPIGTSIKIRQLSDRWNVKTFRFLENYLAVTCKNLAMNIILNCDNLALSPSWTYLEPQLGKTHVAEIDMSYKADKGILTCKIYNDEFLPEAQKYCKNIDISGANVNICMYDELQGNKALNKHFIDPDVWQEALKKIGDFEARIFFSLNTVISGDEDKFLYKRKSLENRYDNGIALYRNAFSSASFEGSKDWLEIGRRAAGSPAAATHPTGRWRVRRNHVSGFVLLDKKENKEISDLSNRQGINENEIFIVFKEIILTGIDTFELYRQGIIREINKKNKIETSNIELLAKFRKNPQKESITYSKEDWSQLKEEMKADANQRKEEKQKYEEREMQFRYDSRILNVFATVGLKSLAISHDFKTDRNMLDDFYVSIQNALQMYGFWEILSDFEHTRIHHRNVPYLLERAEDVNKKLLFFLNSILDQAEKKRFTSSECLVIDTLEKVSSAWRVSYPSIDIQIDSNLDSLAVFDIPEDILDVVFDNLILNSIQNYEGKNEDSGLHIEIKVEMINGRLDFEYKDNGPGLHMKYHDNPRRILEPHETTRSNGHGLGMWIVNSAIMNYSGEIYQIGSTIGFDLRFYFESK